MYFANPWGLLGLLALPTIAIIHLYHRRYPPLEIAGLHLWGAEQRKEAPGRTREKLPLTRTLFLELLAALLLSLLLAEPRLAGSGTRPHLVLVLDNSASMSAATPNTGESSRTRALEWLKSEERRLGRNVLISALITGRRPTLIAGPRADWSETWEKLDAWDPRATRHAFAPAWDLGVQLAGEEGNLIFLTDHLPAEEVTVPQRMEVRSFGRKLDNVAFTATRWVYDAETGEGSLFARVANLGENSAQVQLSANARGQTLINESHDMPAGGEKSFEWLIPGGLGQLELRAEIPGDPLPLDNRVLLVEPQVRLVTVALLLPSVHPSYEPVRRILGVIPRLQLGDPDEADLVIAPAADTPYSRRGLWWLGIGPVSQEASVVESARTLIGPYLVEKQHPLMNGIVLGGVVWGGVQPTPTGLLPIVSTGESLLFGQWANLSNPAYLLNIDLRQSNLPESPDWPIFWTNLIEECRLSRPGFRRWNYHLDESISFTLDPARLSETRPLELLHQGESRPLIRLENVEISPRESIGLYEVRDGSESLGKFAVNFLDREEPRLLDLASGVRKAEIPADPLGIHWDNPFSWLLAIGLLTTLALLLADWYILRPLRN